MEPLIKGRTQTEKLESVERILQHFRRRLGKKIVVLKQPIPIFHHEHLADASGLFFQGVLPFGGTISKLAMCVVKRSQEEVRFSFTLEKDRVAQTHEISTRKLSESFDVSVQVAAGTLVSAYIEPAEGCEDISLGLLIYPEANVAEVQTYLIDELLKDEETQDAGESEQN
jgi:hypothetical protein